MKKLAAALLISVSLLNADVLFHKGAVALGVGVGSGTASFSTSNGTSPSQNYFIVGLGADYFVVDNLSIGASVLSWIGDSPTIMQYTLPVVYYIETDSKVSPYGGVFYRFTDYIGNYEDRFAREYEIDSTSAAGLKAGIAYKVDFGYLGIGIVLERYFETKETSNYPEFSLGFVF